MYAEAPASAMVEAGASTYMNCIPGPVKMYAEAPASALVEAGASTYINEERD